MKIIIINITYKEMELLKETLIPLDSVIKEVHQVIKEERDRNVQKQPKPGSSAGSAP